MIKIELERLPKSIEELAMEFKDKIDKESLTPEEKMAILLMIYHIENNSDRLSQTKLIGWLEDIEDSTGIEFKLGSLLNVKEATIKDKQKFDYQVAILRDSIESRGLQIKVKLDQ